MVLRVLKVDRGGGKFLVTVGYRELPWVTGNVKVDWIAIVRGGSESGKKKGGKKMEKQNH
jgi:hypothetical protein